MSQELRIKDFGPIADASIDLGDLTLLLGPQASGKSLALQCLKLAQDRGSVTRDLVKQGWQKSTDMNYVCSAFFGEGFTGLWKPGSSQITWSRKDLFEEVKKQARSDRKSCYYIPAQRVQIFDSHGWPKSSREFSLSFPYVIKDFSSSILSLMDQGLGRTTSPHTGTIFPQKGRLGQTIRDSISGSIYTGFELVLDQTGPVRRIALKLLDGTILPICNLSAGQAEFTPFLLGLYYLLPAGKVSRKDSIEYVIIEELESGLHPRAIEKTMLSVFELLTRGYKVLLSTHSLHVLEVVWATQEIASIHLEHPEKAQESFLKLFDIKKSKKNLVFAQECLSIVSKVFYFNTESGRSTVEPVDLFDLENSDSRATQQWGGMTRFSSHASRIISQLPLK